MNQNIWGRHLWFFLHTLTLNYPLDPTQDDKKNITALLNALKTLIPCSVCRKHYEQNIAEYEPELDNREKFFKWMVDLHNVVNGYTGRRAWSYDEVLKYYEHEYMTEFHLTEGANHPVENLTMSFKSLSWNFLISIGLLVALYFLFNRRNHRK